MLHLSCYTTLLLLLTHLQIEKHVERRADAPRVGDRASKLIAVQVKLQQRGEAVWVSPTLW